MLKQSKMVLFVILSTLILNACSHSNVESNVIDPISTDIFDPSIVHELYIEMSEDDWANTLDSPLSETYYPSTITFDGVTVNQVGVRTKGNSSLRAIAQTDSIRYSFRIKLDKYLDNQTLLGMDEFVVNNMYADASYMREILTYQIMGELGLNVPQTAFVKLTINGEYMGLYLAVEAIDNAYLVRHFGNDDGNLYKADGNSTLQVGTENTFSQKNGKDTSKTDLTQLINALNTLNNANTDALEELFNVDSALMMLAANGVLANYDSYNGQFIHNYYLYSDDGYFTCLPWDLNMSIGSFGGASSTDFDIYEPVLNASVEDLPLIDKLLSIDKYKEMYLSYIQTLLGLLEDFEERVDTLDQLIREEVLNDPTKLISFDDYLVAITYDPDYIIPESENRGTLKGFNQRNDNIPRDQNTPPNEQPNQPMNEQPNQPMNEQPNPPMNEQPNQPMNEQPNQPMNEFFNRGNAGGQGMQFGTTPIINVIKERVEAILKQI